MEHLIIDIENGVEWQEIINHLRSQSKSGQNSVAGSLFRTSHSQSGSL